LEAGVDTLKVVGKPADDRSLLALSQSPLGFRPTGGGAQLVCREGDASWLASEARVLWYPGPGVLAVEGHPGGAEGVLAPPDVVPAYVDRLRELLGAWGIAWDRVLGVSRCDGTVSLGYDVPSDGLAVLSALAALEPTGRLKRASYRAGDGLETVYVVTPKGRVRGRWYDAGVRHGTADRGRKIRGEDQRRYDRHARRPLVEAISTGSVRQAFQERFVTLAKATEGVTVATLPVIVNKLADRVERKAMKVGDAERALAFAVFSSAGRRGVYKAYARSRRRELLREHGLAVLDGELDPVQVDVSAVLEAALDRGVWGHG
jgi:hypothetical protein